MIQFLNPRKCTVSGLEPGKLSHIVTSFFSKSKVNVVPLIQLT